MKTIRKFFKKLFHQHEYKQYGRPFFAGYLKDESVYLQEYKCSCGDIKSEQVL